MKKSHQVIICLISLCLFCLTAAAKPVFAWRGFYLGALVGASWADYQDYPFPSTEIPTHINDVGIAPMYTFGFGFNQFIAVELGAGYASKIKFLHLHSGATSSRFKNNVVYTAIKLSYLFRTVYRVFAKVGVGYVVRDNVIDQETLIVRGEAVTVPVYGAGIDFRFKPHWEFEIAWLQAARSGANLLPATHFFAAGVHYLFL